MKINGHDIYYVIAAMETFGGSFASAIALAASRADSSNLKRLVDAFPELFAKYAEDNCYGCDTSNVNA